MEITKQKFRGWGLYFARELPIAPTLRTPPSMTPRAPLEFEVDFNPRTLPPYRQRIPEGERVTSDFALAAPPAPASVKDEGVPKTGSAEVIVECAGVKREKRHIISGARECRWFYVFQVVGGRRFTAVSYNRIRARKGGKMRVRWHKANDGTARVIAEWQMR